MDEHRSTFVVQYIMTTISRVTSNPDIKGICDDADYAWDRVINPRPLPKGDVVLIKEATT